MEGTHAMGGPWFAVLKSGDDWHTVDTAWISNGQRHDKVEVQLRVRLIESPPTIGHRSP
jgi:hypothetical protein